MATHGKRRALGQHFLKDLKIAQGIADAGVSEALKHQCGVLLEIGPGKGAITGPILDLTREKSEFKKILIVEKDRQLAQSWKEKTADRSQIQVISEDFLEVPLTTWLADSPLAVVSNLPYSTGTRILTRLAAHPDKVAVMVLMFQAEVAKRLRAGPDDTERGSLSVWIQNRWDVEKFLAVPPSAFIPPPQVQSEVVILTRRTEPRVAVAENDEDHWESFLKTCFAHRRKMLRSSIPWQNALEQSGVDGKKRAQALDWNEWSRLYQAVRQSS